MILLQSFRYLQLHHPYEALTILVVLMTVAAFYALAALLLVQACNDKQEPAISTSKRVWRHLRQVILIVAALGSICLLYAWAVEPYWLEVTHIPLKSAKLKPGLPPITIVQISDLHCNATPRLEEVLPEIIAKQKPDIIVFTGDAINSPGGLSTFQRCMKRLSRLAPTLAVAGNWEVLWKQVDVFQDTGVKELKVESVPIQVKGTEIWIAGVPADDQKCDRALAAVPPESLTIFLNHYPDGLQQLRSQKVDLYLCGHTHGGQVALPIYGAIVTFSNLGKRYEAGLYKRGQTNIYVNRGIGMDPEPFPQIRFCARPEVTVFSLSPS